MSDARETLSYVISADDKASGVIRNIGSELEGLTNKGVLGLRNLDSAWSGLASKKPLTLVKAEQVAQLAQVEAAQAKLNKTMGASGVATKLNAAEYDLLTQKHKQLQKEIDKTAEGHTHLSKVATAASAGILAAGVAVAAGAVKQGIAWEDLGKTIEQETGLSEKSVKSLLATVNNVTGQVPYKLGEVSAAAVLLKTKFHETNPEIEKQAGLMAAFAKQAREETKPAVTGLLSVMQDYRQPLGDVVGLTDELTSVSQATQKPLGDVLNVVERYGPKLQAMGLGLKESIKLLAVFQESGISTNMMGRGLSQALTTADKRLGVTASNPEGNPGEALEKEALAVKKAQDAVDKLNETVPKTVAQQNQLARQREVAVDALGKEQTKYESLKKSIAEAGGAHATIASVIKSEIAQIDHAKSSQEAYSIGIADFGKQVGPSFERAFYNNSAAIKAVDVALGKHGGTAKLVKAEEQTLEGQVTKMDEQWHKTERTLSTVLMPAVGEFLKLLGGGVKDIDEFVEHNKTLAEVLGAGAGIGAAGYLVSKPVKAAVGGAKAVAGGAASILEKLTGSGGTGGISGVRGTTLPGSLMNPVYTRSDGTLGPSGAPMLSGSATKTAEADAAEADAGFAAGARSLLGNLMKGGLVGAAGVIGSQVVGGAVGGKTGKAISSIGSDAAIGAAIGTVVEPGIGTAIGAGFGGVLGELKHLQGGTQGAHLAETAAKGTDPTVAAHLQSGVDNANKVAEKAIFAIEHQHLEFSENLAHWLHDHTFGIVANPASDEMAPYQRKEIQEAEQLKQAQLFGAGRQFGSEHIKEQVSATQGMSGVAQVTSIITDTEKRFLKLPVAAQQGALQSIVAFVGAMQKDGKLPPTAVEEIVGAVEKKFPALQEAFAGAGASSVTALNNALKGQHTLDGVEALVNQWRNVFPQLPAIVGLNLTNAEKEFVKVNSSLEKLAHTGPESERAAYGEIYKKLRDDEIHYFAEMRDGVEGEVKALSSRLKGEAPAVVAPLETAFSRLVGVVQGEMGATVKATGVGAKEINDVLTKELKVLGITAPSKLNQSFGPMPGGGATGLQPTGVGGSSGFGGLAMGGRVPGGVGPDNWTLVDPSGRAAAKVGGSELLIANRHTEAAASQATMAVYGKTLGQMVAGETTPHSAALGGRFVADPGTNFTVGKEPQITADLQRLAEQKGWTIYGISGYRSPRHSLEVGGFANDPHTRGEAADVGINSQELASAAALNAAMLAAVGLERPFYPASPHEINHVQLLGSGASGVAHGALSKAVAAAQTAAQRLKTPGWKGPGGVLGSIGKAALANITRAANARLAGAGAGGGGGASVGHLVPGIMAIEQQAAQIAGVRWESAIVEALLSHESAGGVNEPPSGPLSATGPNQVIPSTFAEYALPGHQNIANPLDNAIASMRYIHSRYGTLAGMAATTGLLGGNYQGYALGGRLEYAGAFGHGGSVTASKPTLALFGDKGPETAHFVPHAATGTRVGGSGLAETQGVNPDTGNIEYHDQEEWAQIRLQHSSQVKKAALYRKAHPKAKATFEDTVSVGGLAAGTVTLPTAGAIDLPRDLKHLSTATWAKVVSAIEKTLKATSDDQLAVGITGKLSKEHGSRAQALTSKAIGDSAGTVLRNLKALPEGAGVAAGGPAVGNLEKLIADAKRSGNTLMVGALRKDVETALKTTTSRVMKAAESAPAGRAEQADTQALGKLQSLAAQASKQGAHVLEQSIFKDIGKTVTNMMSSVSSKLTKSKAATAAPEALKIAQANLAKEAGSPAATSATDAGYLKQEEANENQAIKEMTAARAAVEKLEATERTQIKALIAKEHKLREQQHKLLAKLHAKEKTAREHHHKAEVAAIQASIKRVQAQLGETQTQLAETSTQLGESEAQASEVTTAIVEEGINVVDLQQEYKEAVHDAFKKGIEEAAKALDDQANLIGTELQITEARETIAGTSTSQLSKLKGEQEGVLTPTQQAQANQDLQAYIANANQQMGVLGQERQGEEAALGNPLLTASDRNELQQQIAELTLKMAQLEAGIVTNTEATKELTTASNTVAKTFGGSVGFTYQGQNYAVGGQSSNSASDISVGM